VKVARWTCLKCLREFEHPWVGGAFVMAMHCPYCKGVGVSNEDNTWEIGVLMVEDERNEK